MIKSASELLASFIAAERKKVEPIDMPHMPTLGSAYEAIANVGIEKEFVLPPNLDLRVVSGFIKGIPNQIDGMLVKGEGQRYGLTYDYIYPIEQVLCVLEVKKTLSKADLVDGVQHLAAVQRRFQQSFMDRAAAGEKFDFHLARESYEKLTGRAGPSTERALDALPSSDRLLYTMLARQLYAPVTVLLGFDGYKTEGGLRKAVLDVIESNLRADSDASPELLPSLIIGGNFSVLKLTGRPYLASGPNDSWVLLASARQNVARILLEFLWSKISVFCKVRMPFGLDMDHENLKELVAAQGVSRSGQSGFELRLLSYAKDKLERNAVEVWEPTKLSAGAVQLAEFAGLYGGSVDLSQSLADYIQREYGLKLEDAVAELVATSTFCKQANTLRTVTGNALIASFDDGSGYVDIDAERLRTWCDNQGFQMGYVCIMS